MTKLISYLNRLKNSGKLLASICMMNKLELIHANCLFICSSSGRQGYKLTGRYRVLVTSSLRLSCWVPETPRLSLPGTKQAYKFCLISQKKRGRKTLAISYLILSFLQFSDISIENLLKRVDV